MRTQITSEGELQTARGRKTVNADSSTRPVKKRSSIRRHLLVAGLAIATSRVLGLVAAVQLDLAAEALAAAQFGPFKLGPLAVALAATTDTADTIGAPE